MNPVLVGYLLKRKGGTFGAHKKHAWHSRYFELSRNGILVYYEDISLRNSNYSKPRGKLNLRDITLVKFTRYNHTPPHAFTFELLPGCPSQEKWRLCASSQIEMDRWCKALEAYVLNVTDLSTSHKPFRKEIATSVMSGGRDLTGFLLKRRGGKFGAHMNAWQGRYFEIKNGVICYYEEDVTNVKPRGKMSLVGGEVSLEKYTTYEHAAPSKYTFELVPHDSAEERWRLCAASEEDMQQWCRSIEANLGSQTQGSERAVTEEESSERQDSRGSGDGDEIGDSSGIIDQDKYVSGGDDVIMSLAWQKRSARTMSGIDRVACEAAARAYMLLQEKEGQGKEHESSGAGVSVLEFDDLELGEEAEEKSSEKGSVEEKIVDSPATVKIGSASPLRTWVAKKRGRLSSIISAEKSSPHGSHASDISVGGDCDSPYFKEKPLETEGKYCV